MRLETPVILVFGTAASGAARFARLLGDRGGLFVAGDLKKVWQRGVVDDTPCTCGAPFLRCPFWSAVGESGFGGWTNVDVDRLVPAIRRMHSASGTAKLLVGAQLDDAERGYLESERRLLRAVAEVSGAGAIVCHAKEPYAATVWRAVVGGRLSLIHVVRDPRETAWLWANGTVEMSPRPLPLSTAAIVGRWSRRNGAAPPLARLANVRYRRIRIEDVAAAPERAVAETWDFVGAGDVGGSRLEDHAFMPLDRDEGPCRLVDYEVGHDHDPLALPQDAWRTGLSAPARTAVGAATLPLTAAFGYLHGRR